MATNIREHHVVHPGYTAEYDRASGAHPFALIVGGVALSAATVVFAVFHSSNDVMLSALLLLAAAPLTAGIWSGVTLAKGAFERREALSRDLRPLREIVVFDEERTSDEAIWQAAGLALDYAAVEEDGERLAGARVRTPAQDSELAERDYRLQELTSQISALVS